MLYTVKFLASYELVTYVLSAATALWETEHIAMNKSFFKNYLAVCYT